MLKAVIFDFDGTIGDTLPLVIKAIRYGVEPFIDRELSDDEIAATFGPIEEGSIKHFVPDTQKCEIACKRMYEAYDKYHEEVAGQPIAGVVDLINHLKAKKLIVTLATGKGKHTCDISLAKYKMNKLFDDVETGSIKGGIKPQMMATIMHKYNLKPDEVLYIGDAPTDIDAARKVGVGIVSVLYGSRIEEDAVKAKKPDKICYTVKELQTYLDSLV